MIIIGLLLAFPIYLPCAVICLAMMEGVQETGDAVRRIGKTGDLDTIRRAWKGKSFSANVTAHHPAPKKTNLSPP